MKKIRAARRDVAELRRYGRELRRLHARVISAQETERKRVARDLHDGIGQILSGVKFRLEALPIKLSLRGKAADEILLVGGLLDRAIAEIRRVSQNLMPSELVDLGLEPALATLCREFKDRAGIPVTLRIEGEIPPLQAELELALFRIAQEALNNAGKHSKASAASVTLSNDGRMITLSVKDDGTGFVAARRPAAGRGVGLGNMWERAGSIGGLFKIRSTPGGGTAVTVRAPLSAPEERPL